MRETRKSIILQSVDHALAVLEAFDAGTPELGVTALSGRLKLAKSTVYRLLSTLASRGYVYQNPATGKYRLGLKTFEVGSLAVSQLTVRDVALPYLEKLRDATKETVHLGVRDGDAVIYIEKIETPHAMRMYSRTGRRAPLHCTALGKALLAFSPPAEAARLLRRGLRRYTPHTITDPQVFGKELAKVRERGYALDEEEFEEGLKCVAAPLWDYTGGVVATAGIAGPHIRITSDRLPDLIAVVREVAGEISTRLGYRPGAGPRGA
jgi:DNA-binding IclR family transcriptional regulator